MEDRKLDQIPDMVPWLPHTPGMAAPSDTVLEDATVPTGIMDHRSKPLLMALDNDRWRRRIDQTW